MAVSIVMVLSLENRNMIIKEGKKKLRNVYWRVRAEFKNWKRNHQSRKKRFSFHYDPFSYALNFDDASSSRFF